MKQYLEELKGNNKLTNYVLDYYIDEYDNYVDDETFLESMEDLKTNGCVTGMIRSLIYYDDTIPFYEEYKEEINEILSKEIQMTGLSITEFFGDKFDIEDPLIIDFSNKNLLAWYGFESTSNEISKRINSKLNGLNCEF